MNQGFSSIIAEGMRSGNEAQAKAFENLGAGVSSAVGGARQYIYNKGYKKLLEEKNAIPIIGNIDPAKREEIENRIRNYEMIGQTKGLRTALTGQDYERRDAAEAAAKERERQNIIQAYNAARSNMRMYDGQATNMLGSGVINDEISEAILGANKKAALHGAHSAKVAKYGEMIGVNPVFFEDFGRAEQEEERDDAKYISPDVLATTAQIFMDGKTDKPTKAEFNRYLGSNEYNYSDAQKDYVWDTVLNIYETNEANRKVLEEKEDRNRSINQANEAHAAEMAAKARAAKAGDIDVENAVALKEAQIDWLSEPKNWVYTPENAVAMEKFFKDFKSDENLGGSTISGMLTNWANKRVNEDNRRVQYEAAIKILKKRLPNQPPNAANSTAKNDDIFGGF